jgi:hypothetical protein
MSKNILKYNNHRVFFVISIYESIKKYQVYCNGYVRDGQCNVPDSVQGHIMIKN